MIVYKHNSALRNQLCARLQQFSNITSEDSEALTRAAVAIAVSTNDENGQACILLTRRSSNLRNHAGQYALPGGKLDAGETLTEAALRELSEELNLTTGPDNVMGLLDDFPTQSGFCITPVVVWIENHLDMQPNPDEVAAVFEVPLTELAKLSLGISTEDEVEINMTADDSQPVMSIHLPSAGTTIYSPTAAIIYQFREVALAGKSTRVAHFGQPRFAWR